MVVNMTSGEETAALVLKVFSGVRCRSWAEWVD